MNWADYALLLVLLVSMGVGLWRGFVVEVLSLTVWVAAFWLSMGFGADVAAWFTGVEEPSARLFLGYAGVFVGVLLLGGLITWALGKFIANTGLSATDRVLGVGFGLLRGLVLACVAVLLMGFTTLPSEPWWQASKLMPGVQLGAEWMQGFLPASAADELRFAPPAPATPEMIDPVVPHEAAGPPVPEN
ncbi:CvpA family protein [Arenimonas sp.]|uniref:CvpA family protein n=1 Tax=Arenimonas sp. TaxID=1872635 RepID=UPI002E32D71D|nr:CvpA family protein [Arenimonas sp.]HEX4854502.1 CvpA family protein [Arenimonas sp.]